MHRRARHVRRQRGEVELHVRARERRIGAREHAALVDADRHRSGARRGRSVRPSPSSATTISSVSLVVIGFVQRKITRACRWSCRFSPTPGSACTTGMPNGCSSAGGPIAGELQELRRLQRARGEDHFAPRGDGDVAAALAVDDAARAPADRAAIRVAWASVSTARLARPRAGPQVGDGRRAAKAAARRELVVADAFLRRAVEIVVARNAELAAGGDQRFDQLVLGADVGHPQRSVGAVPFARAADVVLELAESTGSTSS